MNSVKITAVMAIIFLPFCPQVFANSDSTETDTSTAINFSFEDFFKHYADSMDATMHYETGTVSLGNGEATLIVPPGFRFLGPEEARHILEEEWGNPPSETFGLLFPTGQSPFSPTMTYAVEISYDEDGYVEDDDAQDIDYDDLLEEMQESAREQNPQRIAQGYPGIEIVGWASPPFYDSETKKLHWAKELHFDSVENNTLNYNIRVLGRHGYLTMNVIADMENLPAVQTDIDKILGSVNFNEGYAYKDFDSSIDKVAAFGIGGLIAGKVLAKAGFFAIILKFWKIIAIAVGGFFVSMRKRLFGGRGE
ncbi:DUF2167 domain-containing protein [bacterium]|nr:DUF2167 domain-containing protein [bacterium]